MGGVVEVNTTQDVQDGLHGQIVLNGGSFASAAAAGQAQYSSGKNTLGGSASGSRTDRYLNPVVPAKLLKHRHTWRFFSSLRARPEQERHDLPRHPS